MKEVSVLAWCDGCRAEVGEVNAEPATVEVTVTLPPMGPRVLDLCESHEKGLVAPLRDLLADVGQEPSRSPQTPARRPGTKPAPEAVNRFPCLWCPETFAAQGGYWGHATRVHGLPEGSRSGSVYGKRCPSCGKSFSTVPSLGTHGRIVHGAYSIAMLFRMAEDEGDRHKLVARVMKKGHA